MDKTDHQSFILKPSTVHRGGVGVFTLHDTAAGTYMALFANQFEEEIRNPEGVPEELQGYCLSRPDGKLLCPKKFNQMDIGNYLNHSKNANLKWIEGKGYFALRDIEAGEELLANYRELGEPEEARENYY